MRVDAVAEEATLKAALGGALGGARGSDEVKPADALTPDTEPLVVTNTRAGVSDTCDAHSFVKHVRKRNGMSTQHTAASLAAAARADSKNATTAVWPFALASSSGEWDQLHTHSTT